MSWANLKELIFQERKMLDPVSLPDFPQDSAFETRHSALLGCYLSTKAQVDAAIHSFAQTLEWPEMTPVERFFVAGRLDFAWELLCILNTGHDGEMVIDYPGHENARTSNLLEWLLIDIWPYGCGRFLQSQKSFADRASTPQRQYAYPVERAKADCVA